MRVKNSFLFALIFLLSVSLFGCINGGNEAKLEKEGQSQEIPQQTDESDKEAVAVGAYQETNLIVYRNTQYGFRFSLPESWKGYSIITDKWEGSAIGGPPSGETVETGPMISIRHPQWTAQNQRQDIPIMVFTLTQWNSLQQGEFHIGAAPVGPSELGRNSGYVFALPARYNYAFPTGYEEVEKILASSPLQANENHSNN